jgi:nitrogen fixation/metabolism regulation signal transduction histidine kinase
MLTMLQNGGPPNLKALGIALALILAAVAWLALYLVRRFFKNTREAHKNEMSAAPRIENSAAFMTASMQGVIQKLREQEKELERLHRIEKERAEHTERLSEEVTRNMPAGFLMVNAVGIISGANPAAEQALGIRGLNYRRYSEVLGESSDLTKLVAQCLTGGKIFRREQVSHTAPAGDTRRLGVTISPVRRGNEKVSGAICLLSDLTELAALQQQMELKKHLAALGELSAGIAHEFKNALATISGYAQMIRAESADAEILDHAERILEQTRNITHVVTEFLKYARPLEISEEVVEFEGVVERVVAEVGGAMPQAMKVCCGRRCSTWRAMPPRRAPRSRTAPYLCGVRSCAAESLASNGLRLTTTARGSPATRCRIYFTHSSRRSPTVRDWGWQ